VHRAVDDRGKRRTVVLLWTREAFRALVIHRLSTASDPHRAARTRVIPSVHSTDYYDVLHLFKETKPTIALWIWLAPTGHGSGLALGLPGRPESKPSSQEASHEVPG
jgi:hypothetical protein